MGLVIVMGFSFTNVRALTDQQEDVKKELIESMEARQQVVGNTFDRLDTRIKGMHVNDPKKDTAKEFLKKAEDAVDAFGHPAIFGSKGLKAKDEVEGPTSEGSLDFRPSDDFQKKELAAIKAINDVNQYLIRPVHPGAEGVTKKGTVPAGGSEGGIIEDFIPQFIRLLFRFASLAVFVSFVVSGVMFVSAFGNEERITKAKQLLYYTLIGFAFVTLAFAIVKAVTDIDFFGFI